MTFIDAVKTCLSDYATFKGRAKRSEYWWFALFSTLLSLAAGVVNDKLNILIALALFLPSIAVTARRLHDIGRSGWWQLLWVVPVIGWIVMIYWLVQPSDPNNQYGYNGDPDDQMTMMPPPGAV